MPLRCVGRSRLRVSVRPQDAKNNPCNFIRQQRWYRVANLDVLLSPRAFEQIVVGERLEARGFSHREASALRRIGMDEVVTVLRDVRRDRC